MTYLSANQLWQVALDELERLVTRPNFETWLRGTIGLRGRGGLFVVGVANDFALEWLSVKLRPLIAQILSRLLSQPVEVEFELAEKAPVSPQAAAGLPAADPPARNAPPLLRPALHHRYTFDRFVIGNGNRLAHAAALAVAANPGSSYNPLFLYGGVGLGKTHLLHAIGHEALAHNYTTLYVTAEQFTNEFVAAITQSKTDAFRNKYRQVHVLLIDDVQFLAGKERTQEEFFFTFNDLHSYGSQIVISSDRPPRHISLFEDRLRSRCEWGLIADLQPLEREARLAILRTKAMDLGLMLTAEVMDLIVRRASDSVRELEGLLNRVIAFSRLARAPSITLPLAEEALSALDNHTPRIRPSPEAILQAIAAFFGLTQIQLTNRGRQRALVRARHIAMYLMHTDAQTGPTAIGRLLGQRDHTTVLHGIQKIGTNLNTDLHLQQQVSSIRKALYHA